MVAPPHVPSAREPVSYPRPGDASLSTRATAFGLRDSDFRKYVYRPIQLETISWTSTPSIARYPNEYARKVGQAQYCRERVIEENCPPRNRTSKKRPEDTTDGVLVYWVSMDIWPWFTSILRTPLELPLNTCPARVREATILGSWPWKKNGSGFPSIRSRGYENRR